MDTRFAISEYHDAAAINRQLDELIAQPIYTIKPDVLKKYEEEYYEKKYPSCYCYCSLGIVWRVGRGARSKIAAAGDSRIRASRLR